MSLSSLVGTILKEARRKFSSNIQNHFSVVDILSEKPVGRKKTVKGWVKSIRRMKNYVFLDVTDGSCISSLQIVVPKEIYTEKASYRSSVDITGILQTNNNDGTLELVAESFNVIGNSDISDGYPFTPKHKHSYDHYRQYLHFRPQVKYFSSMLRFRSAASMRIHNYFKEKGFVEIHTPIITSNDCEGAGEIFSVKPYSENLLKNMKKKDFNDENNETIFFNTQAFLTVSGQLHLEAVVRSIPKVYNFNPVFRAENSKSRLHLSEFYMIEAEEAFVSDLNIILHRIEGLIKDVLSFLLSHHLDEMKYMLNHNKTNFNQHMTVLENVLNKKFSVMTFSEAKSLLHKNYNYIQDCKDNSQNCLTKKEELFLVENNNNIPIFIIEWPKYGKPFYMKISSENSELVNAVDLLFPNVGELCGGSLREDNFDVLKSKLIELKLYDSMKWYLDIRKFGNVPSGGFGVGFERFLQFLLNCGNIKDTIPFPRYPHGLQL